MNNITNRYPKVLRNLHWIIFGLVALAYASINARKLFERGTPERLLMSESHFLLGILALVLVLPRLVVRLRSTTPPITPPVGVFTRWASNITHVLLYAFLIVQPLLGIASRMIEGKPIGLPLTEWAIPSLMAKDETLGKMLEEWHEVLGTAFYYVIGLHILAALWHWRVRRDNVLQRML